MSGLPLTLGLREPIGHVGIYPYMFQHFCRSFARPVRWLNFEQDMGLPGFRRSKRSYGPAGLISKLRVALRD